MSNSEQQRFDQQQNQVPASTGADEGTAFRRGGNEFQNSSQWNEPSQQTWDRSDSQYQDRSQGSDERGQQFGGTNAYNAERPLNVQPTSQGGVTREGRQGLPEGKAGFTDVLVGKTEKVTGKFSNNPELHEKGELRESGGRAAQRGEARAPHD